MIYKISLPKIPSCAWSHPIGLEWDNPYTADDNKTLDDGPSHGMPLGGFGAGCIGRAPRGDFNLWHLDAGEHIFRNLPACQFSVFEQPEGENAQAYAMSTVAPTDGSLSSWSWYPKDKGTYYALYPRSWYEYQGVFKSQLICEQFSPIYPNSYQESSYPLGILEWTAHNPTDKPITISIMLTWQNTVGWFTNAMKSCPQDQPQYQPRWGDSTGNYNQWILDNYRVGCLFNRVQPHEQLQEGEGQIAIASITNPSLEVFYLGRWNPIGDGSEVWDYFAMNGSLPDLEDETPASPGEQIAGAMAIRFTVRPGRTRKIPFILAWDFPITEFSEGINYYRRYTDFYGRSGHNVWSVVRTALKHNDMWKERIIEWQSSIIQREDLSDSFKMALFNELYLLTDGGTIWTAATENDPIGQFGVLESLDAPYYESLNVRLYGSFALLMLWPRLDKAILDAFARAISDSDETSTNKGIRKALGATPHDLGSPHEHPWEKTNYSTNYNNDVDYNLCQDLPAAFVLQVYRDFVFTGKTDTEFLWECWQAIGETLTYLKDFDVDGDGIPENSLTCDYCQFSGISAYNGGLWIAALEAAVAMAKILLDNPPFNPQLAPSDYPASIEQAIALWQSWLEQAQPLYHQQLWNDLYYNMDSESGSDMVMVDQLCGQFYVLLLGLPDVVEKKYVQSTLNQIYNVCIPDNSQHWREVKTGINFALAAFMLKMGMKDESKQLAETVIKQIYGQGLQFRSPKYITNQGTFRGSHYLGALAIWGIYRVMID